MVYPDIWAAALAIRRGVYRYGADLLVAAQTTSAWTRWRGWDWYRWGKVWVASSWWSARRGQGQQIDLLTFAEHARRVGRG